MPEAVARSSGPDSAGEEAEQEELYESLDRILSSSCSSTSSSSSSYSSTSASDDDADRRRRRRSQRHLQQPPPTHASAYDIWISSRSATVAAGAPSATCSSSRRCTPPRMMFGSPRGASPPPAPTPQPLLQDAAAAPLAAPLTSLAVPSDVFPGLASARRRGA